MVCGENITIPEHAIYSQLSGVITSSDTLWRTMGPCTTKITNLPSSIVTFDLLYSVGLTANIIINNKSLTTRYSAGNPLLVNTTSRNVTISYSPEESHLGAFIIKFTGKFFFIAVTDYSASCNLFISMHLFDDQIIIR